MRTNPNIAALRPGPICYKSLPFRLRFWVITDYVRIAHNSPKPFYNKWFWRIVRFWLILILPRHATFRVFTGRYSYRLRHVAKSLLPKYPLHRYQEALRRDGQYTSLSLCWGITSYPAGLAQYLCCSITGFEVAVTPIQLLVSSSQTFSQAGKTSENAIESISKSLYIEAMVSLLHPLRYLYHCIYLYPAHDL